MPTALTSNEAHDLRMDAAYLGLYKEHLDGQLMRGLIDYVPEPAKVTRALENVLAELNRRLAEQS